ncbi:MAG: hypothetical protein SV760_01815 [Halobacteria archaeon]|nr:hypothetical protein [Halobacteria archaeon]
MDCPYCDVTGSRMRIHHHLMDEHPDAVENTDEPGIYSYSCPECGHTTEVEAGTGNEDEGTDDFSNEVTMLAFDKLLDHLEKEHGY